MIAPNKSSSGPKILSRGSGCGRDSGIELEGRKQTTSSLEHDRLELSYFRWRSIST